MSWREAKDRHAEHYLHEKKLQRRRVKWRNRIIILALLSIVPAFAVNRAVHNSNLGGEQQADVPLIKADASPTKLRPAQPGGMEVPHQDKLVYDKLDPTIRKEPVERLLPPPEDPMPSPGAPRAVESMAVTTAPWPESDMFAPAAPSGQDPGFDPADLDPDALTNALRAPPSTPAPQPQAVAEPEPEPEPKAVVEPKTVEEKPPANEEIAVGQPAQLVPPSVERPASKPTPTPAPATAKAKPAKPAEPKTPVAEKSFQMAMGPTPGGVKIQLGAVRSEEAARAEWNKLRNRYGAQLAGLQLSVAKANLGEKGTYYRIQAGPLDTGAAQSICSALKKQNVGCMVVR